MLKKTTQKLPSRGRTIILGQILLMTLGLTACGESYRFEDFTFVGPGKTEATFSVDSKVCEEEKDKHSNKIQGREFGFKGQDVGYLGCMKLKGWEKKEPRLY